MRGNFSRQNPRNKEEEKKNIWKTRKITGVSQNKSLASGEKIRWKIAGEYEPVLDEVILREDKGCCNHVDLDLFLHPELKPRA